MIINDVHIIIAKIANIHINLLTFYSQKLCLELNFSYSGDLNCHRNLWEYLENDRKHLLT